MKSLGKLGMGSGNVKQADIEISWADIGGAVDVGLAEDRKVKIVE